MKQTVRTVLWAALLPVVLLPAACAAPFAAQDLPDLPPQQALWFRLDRLDGQGNTLQTSLLSVQGRADGGSRWMQTDVFGAPQARLLATAQGWQNDGFAPPNSEAKSLFVRMFPLLRQGLDKPHTVQTDDALWQISPIEQSEGE